MSLGPLEILLIVVVIALLFGAKKLPELMKGMGQGIREFKSEVKDPVPPAQTVTTQTLTGQAVAGEPITDIPSRHLGTEGETVVARVSESAAQATAQPSAVQPSAVQPGERR